MKKKLLSCPFRTQSFNDIQHEALPRAELNKAFSLENLKKMIFNIKESYLNQKTPRSGSLIQLRATPRCSKFATSNQINLSF
jgi:hypothetical protein